MHKVVLDESLLTKLNGLNGQVELCDESGRTVGHFLPVEVYKQMLIASSKAHVTDEKLKDLGRQTGGRTLAEIWKSLGRQ